MAITSHDGWRSRDYLPHFDRPGLVQAVTFRLADSLPAAVVAQWEQDSLAYAADERHAWLDQRLARWLDRGHGACRLRDPRIAALVQSALLHFDGERYRLLAWCVMPNHVHALVEVLPDHPLAGIVHSWKSHTAHAANRVLGRTGEFWMREYHDRFIRDAAHFRNAKSYIEMNPVAAGLATFPADWPWSSAQRPAGRPDAPPSTPPLGPPASRRLG